MLADARFFHEKLSTLPGVNFPSTMLETVVQEKPVMRRSVLNPNGVVVSGPSDGDNAGDLAPRPRGSIDLQGASRSSPRQTTANSSGPSINNIAARPSPFARRALGNLWGGINANLANASQASLSSSTTREGSPTPTTPQTQGSNIAAIGSSGPGTPELESGRALPAGQLSPPHTPAKTLS
jgi:vacuolar protein sorting-associated protein 54